jgi:putative phosphoesterase
LKVLILSDIHGNLHALEAVLQQVPHDLVVCCGDIVVDFPYPEECVTVLRERRSRCCLGNNDAFIAQDLTPSHHLRAPYLHYAEALDKVVELTQQLISADSKSFLQGLPRELRIAVDGRRFYLNHTGPGLPIHRYLQIDTPLSELRRIYSGTEADVLVTGHTHIPYVKQLGQKVLINPGSVGESRDGDPRASYATFDTGTGRAEHGRLAYDVQSTLERLAELDFPNYARYALRYGRLPENPDDSGA